MRKSWTDDDLRKFLPECSSIRQLLQQLKLIPAGGNYKTINSRIAALGLSIEHISGKGWLKNKTHSFAPKMTLSAALVKNSPYKSTSALRRRLLKEGVMQNICDICSLANWLNKDITLHLDHINGVNTDNRLENLRLLCPNCHSQTSTYCGRNKKKAKASKANPDLIKERRDTNRRRNNCLNCDAAIVMGAKRCSKCAHRKQMKIIWPPSSELLIEVKETSYCAAARRLGVSDSAVRKRIKNHP